MNHNDVFAMGGRIYSTYLRDFDSSCSSVTKSRCIGVETDGSSVEKIKSDFFAGTHLNASPNNFCFSRNKFSSLITTNSRTMASAPKKPDTNAGTQGAPKPSKAPQSSDNENRRYEVVERGQMHTLSYRCYFRDVQTKAIVSPFHDIPLVNEEYTKASKNGETIYNMVVEVPRWTNAKMEINKQMKLNPLVQDVKNGSLGSAPLDRHRFCSSRKTAIREQCFSLSRLSVELRRVAANLGGSEPHRFGDSDGR